MSVPRRPAVLVSASFLALVAATAAPADAGAKGPSEVIQDIRMPEVAPNTPVRATFSVRLPGNDPRDCRPVNGVGVAVRNELDDGGTGDQNFDYPMLDIKKICAGSPQVFTTGARTFTEPGRYKQFVYYRDAKGYHNLPAVDLRVTYRADRTDFFKEEFETLNLNRWRRDESGAYEYVRKGRLKEGDKVGTTNAKDNKLDRIDPAGVRVEDGWAKFTAKPDPHGRTLKPLDKDGNPMPPGTPELPSWNTGLLTTQHSADADKNMVKIGDYVETKVKLPPETGAWPGLWTWNGPRGEVDTFEYHPGPLRGTDHPGHPNRLELTNRTHETTVGDDYTSKQDIEPNKPVVIGTYYGATSVDWFVNDRKVYSDDTGVPNGWSAHLILNLSVSGPRFGRQPAQETKEITFDADYVRVYR